MLKKKSQEKIIVVLGPTASGKTSLAILLAKKFNGEVISADSRQVYTGLDIGTGKVTKKEMGGIQHYLIDVINPKKTFTASEFKKLGEKAIQDILKRDKVPIVAGGTGFYIDSLLGNTTIPEVPPNTKLRLQLESLTTETLFKKLQKLDPDRSKTIDQFNKRRLVRALEIVESIGKVPKIQKIQSPYKALKIGPTLSDEELKEKINSRLFVRIRQGVIAEARNLHKKGLSWKRMEELGLEYRYLSRHLRGQLTKAEMIEQLNIAIWQYAKRQMRWFKRDKKIKWFAPEQTKKIEKMVKRFLKE